MFEMIGFDIMIRKRQGSDTLDVIILRGVVTVSTVISLELRHQYYFTSYNEILS